MSVIAGQSDDAARKARERDPPKTMTTTKDGWGELRGIGRLVWLGEKAALEELGTGGGWQRFWFSLRVTVTYSIVWLTAVPVEAVTDSLKNLGTVFGISPLTVQMLIPRETVALVFMDEKLKNASAQIDEPATSLVHRTGLRGG